MTAAQTTNLQALRQPAAQASNVPAVHAGFFDLQSFELMQRVSKAFASSDLVPQQYRGADKIANCMIAMDMAQRIGANPLMVMQNLYIVHGTPSWSSKFLIATINACGRFSSLRYEWKGEPGGKDYGCRAWAIEKATGERLDGIWVTWEMVQAEGWASKNGSKWKTMPDQMFVYRAAAFWQRAYAPELGMGLQTAEEVGDIFDAAPDASGNYVVTSDDLRQQATPAEKTVASDEPPFDVDTTTGEVLTQQTVAQGLRQQREAEPVQQHQQEEQGSQQQSAMFGLDDALEAVRRGAFDEARDIARSLSEKDGDIVEQTIANQQKAGSTTRTRRQRDVE